MLLKEEAAAGKLLFWGSGGQRGCTLYLIINFVTQNHCHRNIQQAIGNESWRDKNSRQMSLCQMLYPFWELADDSPIGKLEYEMVVMAGCFAK